MSRPLYLFLVCPDPELIKTQIKERLQQTTQESWTMKTFWGDDEVPLPEVFWTDLTIKSLFPEPKALIIRRAHALKAEHWDKLDAAVKGLGHDVYPIFCLEGEWKTKKAPIPAALSRRNLFKSASKNKWVWESQGLDRRSLVNFIRQWAQSKGMTFEQGAEQTLGYALPVDAVAVQLELDKIELAAGETKIVRKSHVELIAKTGEMAFFDLMDALARPGAEAAIWKRVLDDHDKASKDQMLFNLIGFLASQARMYGQIVAGEKPKGNPYVIKMKTPIARKLGKKGVSRMIDLALDAEFSIKTGTRKYEEVLDNLIAGLIDLFQAKP